MLIGLLAHLSMRRTCLRDIGTWDSELSGGSLGAGSTSRERGGISRERSGGLSAGGMSGERGGSPSARSTFGAEEWGSGNLSAGSGRNLLSGGGMNRKRGGLSSGGMSRERVGLNIGSE